MKTLGILDLERLGMIPEKHWKAHEFCFLMHDKMAELLVEYEASGIQDVVANAFDKALSGRERHKDGIDMLVFLKENNMLDLYYHHLVCHLVMALTGDMLHFVYEALSCFEKRKFSVAYSLLRKPLKESLLFLCWILGDDNDFVGRFEADNYKTLSNVDSDRRVEILQKAISKLPLESFFEADTLDRMMYSKKLENSFEHIWQKATHLITSYGELLKTENYSINFIFQDPLDDGPFDFLYSKLPYILMFASQVALECFNTISALNENTYSHLMTITVGCYESLFMKSRRPMLCQALNKAFGGMMQCIHCGATVRIDKGNSLMLYLHERVPCKKCKLITDVPLYWLMGMSKAKIINCEGSSPSKYLSPLFTTSP